MLRRFLKKNLNASRPSQSGGGGGGVSKRLGGIIGIFFFFLASHLQPMGLNITILPVATKDLPFCPRFTPYNFLSRCKFRTLTTRQPMVEFYLLTFPRFPLRKKRTQILVTIIERTISALAGVQVAYETTRATRAAAKTKPLHGI